MNSLGITPADLDDIAEALDSPDLPTHCRKKLLVLTLFANGANRGFITASLKVSNSSFTRHLAEYREGGLAASVENRLYKPSSSLEPFWQCIVCSFKAAPVADAKGALARIRSLTGVTLSESQARRTMKKMGMTLKKCAQIPAKADPQLQLDFFAKELQPRLQEASRGEGLVFFVDAAHFVLGAFLGMVWCFARPFIRTSPGRQRYSVLGALCSHSKEFVSVRTSGNVNSATLCELFYEIRRLHPEGKITLVMDNARYQRNNFVGGAAEEYGIGLLFLPPYSPNLNLIERLWKLAKKRCLANRYHEDFDAFKTAIDSCLDSLDTTLKSEVESLLTLNFQFFNKSQSSCA